MLLWMVAVIGALAALYACARARRISRRLEQLDHSYWELRYEYTRLRSQVAQLGPEQQNPDAASPDPPVSFVPLSSLKTRPDRQA